LTNEKRKFAFIINWADFLFSSNSLNDDERNNLTLLSKAIKDKKTSVNAADVNESAVIIITNKVSLLPIAFYINNPEISSITIPRPDRLEREHLVDKISNSFQVVLPDGMSLYKCDKKREYIDLLDDFTSREIIQMARLSRKEEKMTFEKLFYLFKYGEKDNPWEKLDYKAVKNIKHELEERVVGQQEAIEKIEKVVIKAYMGLTGMHKASSRSMPKGVMFFVGPTGVGKTELSKALAKFLFGDEQACIRFDMSEYAQQNSDQKLIGAPPGFVGYENGGQLTNAVKAKPFSVILFDEIEKAAKPNPRILDIFLQILEDGRLTDGKGETVYFSDCIIIFTSNLGAAEIQYSKDKADTADKFLNKVKDYFNNGIGRPEILGRIGYDNIVPFNFIDNKDFASQIVFSKLKPIAAAIKEKYRLNLEFDNEQTFAEFINSKSDIAKGGRDIVNKINDILLDSLALFLFESKDDLSSYRDMKIIVKVTNKGLTFDFAN
jgi:DNA polymerase III delta prime subunit